MQELCLTLSCIALATAAFHGGKWEPLSVPEEDAGVDALGSETDSELCETAEEEEEDAVVEGVAAEEEDAADDEDEDLDLGALLESVVTTLGTEAKKAAASDADARAISESRVEANLGLGQRARRMPGALPVKVKALH